MDPSCVSRLKEIGCVFFALSNEKYYVKEGCFQVCRNNSFGLSELFTEVCCGRLQWNWLGWNIFHDTKGQRFLIFKTQYQHEHNPIHVHWTATECADIRIKIPGSYRSHSCEAQWALSCWVESVQAQLEQRERWLHMVVEAGTYLVYKKKNTSYISMCKQQFDHVYTKMYKSQTKRVLYNTGEIRTYKN